MTPETESTPLAGVPPDPGASKPDAVLVVDQMQRRFGGLVAVDVEHMEVQRNVITSLIGPNGAGKTTLFNCVTGFDRAQHGYARFDGVQLQGKFAYQIPRYGLVRTFQLTKALANMTVMENMLLASRRNRGEKLWGAFMPWMWSRGEADDTERAKGLLDRFDMLHMQDEPAGSLSGGQRKLLEMARALMTEPQAVLLDEPMAGVNPRLRQTISEHIVELRDSGMTVMLIEHDMDVVMEISDWIVCMAEGRVIAEGRPGDIRADQAVIDAYLGTGRTADSAPEESR